MGYLKFILKLIPVIIIGQTLYFKFSAAEESVLIFSQLGVEPWGRIGTGVLELLLITMIWSPKYEKWANWGILLTMIGAMFTHIFIVGYNVMSDSGLLFELALLTFVISIVNLKYFNQKGNEK